MSAAWEKAVEMAAELGTVQRARMIEAAATAMLRDPRRIIMALFPMRADWQWPHAHLTLAELYAQADATIRLEPDAYGILAVHAARRALALMITIQGAVGEAAAREVA